MTYQNVDSQNLKKKSGTSNVRIVWKTPYGDNEVAYMARVSAANQHDTPDKLIRYLVKHKHWSPFEMVNMCVEVCTTRSISAQIMRHRSFSFQEFSQRYAQVLDKPLMPELRRQDLKNRQNSIDDLDPTEVQNFEVMIDQHYEQGLYLYKEMLAAGVAKECAREVLPMSTPTKLYMNGNLRSWLHYCDLRTANSTQKEHREIAIACKKLLAENFPHSYKAYYD